jgi:3-hydroxyisobutyrate dehydrogenase
MSAKPSLGYIGIGLMGKPMTLRLLAAGYPVSVWNRSREKLAPVVEKGAKAMQSPAAVARASDIVMMCVTDQNAAQEVVFGANGIAQGAAPGKLVVDFSSIAPDCARDIAARLEKACGMHWIDSPVSGGVPGAEQGTLALMAGGREEDIERVRPIVAHVSQRFTRMGGVGAGQTTKLCNQIISGCAFPVIAEAVRLAEAAGIDATKLFAALQGGFADSRPFQVFGPRMASRTFEPSLGDSSVLLKDLDNAAAVAKQFGVPLPMARTASELYRALLARGGDPEPSALIKLLSGER